MIGCLITLRSPKMGGSSNASLQTDKVNGGMASGIKPGSTMVSDTKRISVSSKDYNVAVSSGGNIELSIWDFLDKDGDYVQVFVDGAPITNPFMISSKVVAAYLNKTEETYFNTVTIDGANTLPLKPLYKGAETGIIHLRDYA